MGDLLLLLRAGAAELVGEVLVEFIGDALAAFALRAFRRFVGESIPVGTVLAAFGYLVIGFAYGAASVILLPHPLFHPTRIHGASLLISPIITGLIMAQIGLVRRRNEKDVVRVESFGYGFTLAFGAAIIRFLFVK